MLSDLCEVSCTEGRKRNSRGIIQVVHLLTGYADLTEFLQYVVSSEIHSANCRRGGGDDITGLLHHSLVAVVSVLCTP